MPETPIRNQIKGGCVVSIETKENQGTGRLTDGVVAEILTSSETHPHGIKVRLEDGQVGRVKNIKVQKATAAPRFVDLGKIEIPDTEDKQNEFKEFYQYDESIGKLLEKQAPESKQAIDGIKKSVQERFATAICSFGNDKKGGFVYLGIKSNGTVVGLDRDKKFGGFSDYEDSFANHMRDRLENLLEDRVFVTSRLEMKFRVIDNKTVCIIQVLPANSPLWLCGKEKTFFVRGPSPRAEKLDVKDQVRYIKDRFPDYK